MAIEVVCISTNATCVFLKVETVASRTLSSFGSYSYHLIPSCQPVAIEFILTITAGLKPKIQDPFVALV